MECEKSIPKDVLVDLCSRFVINVPVQEQSDLIRICFQVELAHWFYIDFYSKNFPQKRPCGLKEFTVQVFNHIPFLQSFVNNIDKIIEEWKEYKFSVPTFGAIILDEDLSHVLLVQNYKSCWGFPKGKVNKEEPPHQCAIREVYEETGFDISNLIHPNEFIEATLNDRVIRLYVIPGVSKDEKFIPRTRNEIKAVDWFPICDIPLNKKDAAIKQLKIGGGNTGNSVYSAFYMVSPFLRKLRQWIYEHSNNIQHRKRRQRHRSCSDIDKVSSHNLRESIEMLKDHHYSEADENVKTENLEGNSEGLESPMRNLKIDSMTITRKLIEVHGQQQHNDTQNQLSQPSDQLSLTSRSFNGSSRLLANLTVSSELNSVLNSEKETSQAISNYSGDSWNAPVDLSARPMLSITSSDSAFRKVEKSTKASRRKRGKNRAIVGKDSSLSSTENFEGTASEKPLGIRKVIECIPSLLNFQFDIGLILEGMNEAVLKNDK